MENNMVKKSIFKQKTFRKTYQFKTNKYKSCFGDSDYFTSEIYDDFQKIDEKDIFICNLEMPLLNEGEEFYIEELEKTVKITKRVRSSKENVCYYVKDNIIEDDESLSTKQRAEVLQENYENKKVQNLEEFKHQVQKSFWFKFINLKE